MVRREEAAADREKEAEFCFDNAVDTACCFDDAAGVDCFGVDCFDNPTMLFTLTFFWERSVLEKAYANNTYRMALKTIADAGIL